MESSKDILRNIAKMARGGQGFPFAVKKGVESSKDIVNDIYSELCERKKMYLAVEKKYWLGKYKVGVPAKKEPPTPKDPFKILPLRNKDAHNNSTSKPSSRLERVEEEVKLALAKEAESLGEETQPPSQEEPDHMEEEQQQQQQQQQQDEEKLGVKGGAERQGRDKKRKRNDEAFRGSEILVPRTPEPPSASSEKRAKVDEESDEESESGEETKESPETDEEEHRESEEEEEEEEEEEDDDDDEEEEESEEAKRRRKALEKKKKKEKKQKEARERGEDGDDASKVPLMKVPDWISVPKKSENTPRAGSVPPPTPLGSSAETKKAVGEADEGEGEEPPIVFDENAPMAKYYNCILADKFMPHQAKTVKWLNDCEVNNGGTPGRMVGSEQGLGKTIMLLGNFFYSSEEGPVLIVGELSNLEDWVKEFVKSAGREPEKGLKIFSPKVQVEFVKNKDHPVNSSNGKKERAAPTAGSPKTNTAMAHSLGMRGTARSPFYCVKSSRADDEEDDLPGKSEKNMTTIEMWKKFKPSQYNIALVNYQNILAVYKSDPSEMKKSPLFTTTWRALMLDEGHNIKAGGAILNALMKIKRRYSIIASGTLFQNRFGPDYHSYLRFIGYESAVRMSQSEWTKKLENDISFQRTCERDSNNLRVRDTVKEISKKYPHLAMPEEERYTYRQPFLSNWEAELYRHATNKAMDFLLPLSNGLSGFANKSDDMWKQDEIEAKVRQDIEASQKRYGDYGRAPMLQWNGPSASSASSSSSSSSSVPSPLLNAQSAQTGVLQGTEGPATTTTNVNHAISSAHSSMQMRNPYNEGTRTTILLGQLPPPPPPSSFVSPSRPAPQATLASPLNGKKRKNGENKKEKKESTMHVMAALGHLRKLCVAYCLSTKNGKSLTTKSKKGPSKTSKPLLKKARTNGQGGNRNEYEDDFISEDDEEDDEDEDEDDEDDEDEDEIDFDNPKREVSKKKGKSKNNNNNGRLKKQLDAAKERARNKSKKGSGMEPNNDLFREITSYGSTKMKMLKTAMRDMLTKGKKMLLFSWWTSALDVVEEMLTRAQANREFPEEVDHLNDMKWVRLDGTMPMSERGKATNTYKTDPECQLYLISIKAGGRGLNLPETDIVMFLEPWWNPQPEEQALARALRILHTKHVVKVVWLLIEGTIEETVYEEARLKLLAAHEYENQGKITERAMKKKKSKPTFTAANALLMLEKRSIFLKKINGGLDAVSTVFIPGLISLKREAKLPALPVDSEASRIRAKKVVVPSPSFSKKKNQGVGAPSPVSFEMPSIQLVDEEDDDDIIFTPPTPTTSTKPANAAPHNAPNSLWYPPLPISPVSPAAPSSPQSKGRPVFADPKSGYGGLVSSFSLQEGPRRKPGSLPEWSRVPPTPQARNGGGGGGGGAIATHSGSRNNAVPRPRDVHYTGTLDISNWGSLLDRDSESARLFFSDPPTNMTTTIDSISQLMTLSVTFLNETSRGSHTRLCEVFAAEHFAPERLTPEKRVVMIAHPNFFDKIRKEVAEGSKEAKRFYDFVCPEEKFWKEWLHGWIVHNANRKSLQTEPSKSPRLKVYKYKEKMSLSALMGALSDPRSFRDVPTGRPVMVAVTFGAGSTTFYVNILPRWLDVLEFYRNCNSVASLPVGSPNT